MVSAHLKNVRQNGNLPQFSGWKCSKYLKPLPGRCWAPWSLFGATGMSSPLGEPPRFGSNCIIFGPRIPKGFFVESTIIEFRFINLCFPFFMVDVLAKVASGLEVSIPPTKPSHRATYTAASLHIEILKLESPSQPWHKKIANSPSSPFTKTLPPTGS